MNLFNVCLCGCDGLFMIGIDVGKIVCIDV